jgi:hypothetical protein
MGSCTGFAETLQALLWFLREVLVAQKGPVSFARIISAIDVSDVEKAILSPKSATEHIS